MLAQRAAYNIRNDLDEVTELGIEIIAEESESKDFNGKTLRIGEVNLRKPALGIYPKQLALETHKIKKLTKL